MLITSKGALEFPNCFLVELSTGDDPVRELSPHACLASLCVFAPALVFTDVAGVDINLLDTVDVGVGVDIGGAGVGGAGVMGVNTDVVTGVVGVGCYYASGFFSDVGVFFLLTRFVCLVDGSSSFRSWGSCLV